MTTIINIALNADQFSGLVDVAVAAARAVGLREVKGANVYAVMSGGNVEFMTTFENALPGFYGILLYSAHWSESRGAFVVTANDILSNLDADFRPVTLIVGRMEEALEIADNQYREAIAANEQVETLADRMLGYTRSTMGETAHFAERDDAELWAAQKIASLPENTYWSVEAVNQSKGGQVSTILNGSGMEVLWAAYVANPVKAEAAN